MNRPAEPPLPRIPAALRALDQWVAWGYRVRNGVTTKIPYLASTTHPAAILASSTDPRSWSTYQQATAALRLATVGLTPPYNGIGFVFTRDDPFCGIDLDSCRDPSTGDLALWARSILTLLHSYAELSPSAKGIHVLVRAHLPQGVRHRHTFAAGGRLEVYDHARYFATTGSHLPSTPTTIQPRQRALLRLLRHLAPPQPPPEAHPAPGIPAPLDDAQALAQIARHPHTTLARLHAGDTGGYRSHSEADLALCALLALYITRDPAQIDRLFRASALCRPKWSAKRGQSTYAALTIAKALR